MRLIVPAISVTSDSSMNPGPRQQQHVYAFHLDYVDSLLYLIAYA